MIRPIALTAAISVALLAVSGAGGAATQQVPKRGGTVVVWAPVEPACLNWLLNCGATVSVDAVLEEVVAGAFSLGPLHFESQLVSGVEYTRKPPFVLTYHLRPEARWSDGVPVSASDFVFTQTAIRRYADPAADSDAAVQRREVRSVRALDAKTVSVVLNGRTADWKSLFQVVLPRHALVGEDLKRVWRDGIDDPKTGAPIGSGPFLVAEWKRGEQLTLVRNPRYWGPHAAYVDRLVLRFGVADPVDALREGSLDVVHRRPDPGSEPEYRQLRGVRQLYGPGRAWEHFDIRIGKGGHPALRNKLVRQALAYGIDRSAIVRAVYGEYLPSWRPSDSAVFLAASRYYRRNWSRYRYRPALARRLLEQAGCQRGTDRIYSCAGERLSLRFVTPPGVRRQIALELAQRELRAAGVEVVPVYGQGIGVFDQIIIPGDFDVALFVWFYAPDVGGASVVYRCGAALNYTGYCQRLVTRDLDQADRILDPAQRARVLNRADRQMAKDVPVIPLWNEPAATTVRSTVRGVVPCFPSLIWHAENWWLDR